MLPGQIFLLLSIDKENRQCYNCFDNRISVPWQAGRVALLAEQDNRVKIPDGTAAVCAKKQAFGENRSLGYSREGWLVKRMQPPFMA